MFAIRQLDISMGNLRKWLSHIEHQLSTPLYFMNSEEMEFKSKLEHQKVIFFPLIIVQEYIMNIKLVNN